MPAIRRDLRTTSFSFQFPICKSCIFNVWLLPSLKANITGNRNIKVAMLSKSVEFQMFPLRFRDEAVWGETFSKTLSFLNQAKPQHTFENQLSVLPLRVCARGDGLSRAPKDPALQVSMLVYFQVSNLFTFSTHSMTPNLHWTEFWFSFWCK